MSNLFCDAVIERLYLDEADETIMQHISSCPHCKAEYEKFQKMNELIKSSAPKAPSLRDSVIEKITSDSIKIDEPKRRHRVPLGTIIAAAAIVLVYSFSTSSPFSPKTSHDAVANETSPILFSVRNSSIAEQESVVSEEQLYADCDIATEDCEDSSAVDGSSGASFVPATGSSNQRFANQRFANQRFANQRFENQRFENSSDNTTHDDGNSGAMSNGIYVKEDTTDSIQKAQTITELKASPSEEFDSYKNDSSLELMQKNTITSAEAETTTSSESEQAAEKSEAYDLFKKMQELYSDRISHELFLETKPNIYISFVNSLTDYDNQYTAKSLEEFSKQYGN